MYNTLAILESVKKDIEGGNYHVSPARFAVITDEIIRIREEIAKKAAKASGKTNLLKACKSILKAANKGYNRALHGVTTINGTSYVCDNSRLIAFPAGAVDLPGIPENVKPLDFESIMKHDVFSIELSLPDAGYIKEELKRIKAAEKAAGRKPYRYIIRISDMFFNAEYLKDAIEATGASLGHSCGEKCPLHVIGGENASVTAIVLPIHPGSVSKDLKDWEVAAIY